MLPWLDHRLWFPPTATALDEPNGLLAAGGDLSPERLLLAYRRGIFPWFDEDSPILWWSPAPRCVLLPESLHVSRSMAKQLRRAEYEVSLNRAFSQVIAACASTPREGQSGTWIQPSMIAAYQRLHELGWAHSVEVWHNQQLVGGLYGLAIGAAFFGESMFSLRSNASKTALIIWTRQLQQWGCQLIDCQMRTDHLLSLGAQQFSRREFECLLKDAINAHTNLTECIAQHRGLRLDQGGRQDAV
ncbi:leucyl/phenylalanyl-tRNA--protein transferase [Balneatrix alpica]|uniref:leucyl/phenylalanyl-tRNA--protein transferase n=1 Tax=Balneatrix alpica TaxID=75684 RepID=UPI0027391670|nr:leucyl/phenylalanyl-tRNA--protein transferase [Balneatrix alpica]